MHQSEPLLPSQFGDAVAPARGGQACGDYLQESGADPGEDAGQLHIPGRVLIRDVLPRKKQAPTIMSADSGTDIGTRHASGHGAPKPVPTVHRAGAQSMITVVHRPRSRSISSTSTLLPGPASWFGV
jgi:hypothetical protein